MRASTLVAAVALVACADLVFGSSHSEAPGITKTPQADNVDFYMFRSYENGRQDYVTFIMDVNPLQEPYGGPNYFSLSDDHFYNIHIDNDGDAVEDITFEFFMGSQLGGLQSSKDFNPEDELCYIPNGPPPPPETIHLGLKVPILDEDGVAVVNNPDQFIPLKFIGPISSYDDPDANWKEYYHMNVVYGTNGAQQQITKTSGGASPEIFQKPLDYAGEKTFGSSSDYESYARDFIFNINIPGCNTPGKIFVGQRTEPFHVNLGEVFDLVNFIPIEGFIDNTVCNNELRYINVDSFVLEVPRSCLLSGGSGDVIGAWTTVTELCHTGNDHVPGKQVSRLGHPLVNELVIGLAAKQAFNEGEPSGDAQFANFVQYPSFASILNVLFKDAVNAVLGQDYKNIAPHNFPRDDLVAIFLTGIAGLNQPAGVTASEMLRLNTSVPIRARGQQDPIGFINGDSAGFPNGRRPGDDVVDIVLRCTMGRVCKLGTPYCSSDDAPVGDLDFTDGAPVDSTDFDDYFPYLRTPVSGSPYPGRTCSAGRFVASLVLLFASVLATFLFAM